jgi:hypothetical protein
MLSFAFKRFHGHAPDSHELDEAEWALRDQMENGVETMGESRIETFEEDGKAHEALVYDLPTADVSWAPSSLPAGHMLNKPEPLFKKLDESVVEEELARLG